MIPFACSKQTGCSLKKTQRRFSRKTETALCLLVFDEVSIFLRKGFQFLFVRVAVEDLARDDLGVGSGGLQVLNCQAEAGAAGGGEQHDLLAAEIIRFQEGVDDRRGNVPPNREQ